MSLKKNNRRVSFAFSLTFAVLALLQLAFCLQVMSVVAESDVLRRLKAIAGADPKLVMAMLALANLAALALAYRISRQCILGKGVGARARRIEMCARSTLDALPSHVAILDDAGVVLDTNAAWREFASACPKDGAAGTLRAAQAGENYLALCDEAGGRGNSEASSIAAGIRAVALGKVPAFAREYAVQTG